MEVELIPQFHTVTAFPEQKVQQVLHIFQHIWETEGVIKKIVILTSTDKVAKDLHTLLNQLDTTICIVHGGRKDRKNRRAAEGFSDGTFDVLIVSKSRFNVEIGDVAHFVLYDVIIPGISSLRTTRNTRQA